MSGKIQNLEDSLDPMKIFIKYTSELTPTATTEIVAPKESISFYKLLRNYDYNDRDDDSDWDDYDDYDDHDYAADDRYYGGRIDKEEFEEIKADGTLEGATDTFFTFVIWIDEDTKEQTTDAALLRTLTQKFSNISNVLYLVVPNYAYSPGSAILNNKSGEYVIVNKQDLATFQEAMKYLL